MPNGRISLVPLTERMWNEYSFFVDDHDVNPPKQSIMLASPKDDVWKFVNIMGAKLSNGRFGSKTVYVNEETGQIGGDVLYYDADGDLLARYPARIITPFRCGIMTAMCLSLRELERERIVSMIGMGEIGVATVNIIRMMHNALGIDQIRMLGTPRNPVKNLNRIIYKSRHDNCPKPFFVYSQEELAGSTSLVTATNNTREEALIHLSNFPYPPIETVSHDTGWMLAGSFRRWRRNFTDHTGQLWPIIDKEFPFDDREANIKMHAGVRDLPWLADLGPTEYSSTYLYGIALADLVVAEALHTSDIEVDSLDELLALCDEE
jgi:hypothetical protein